MKRTLSPQRQRYLKQYRKDRAHRKAKREYQKQWKAKRRQEYLTLLGGRCADCPETDPKLLEFDHIDPSTKAEHATNLWSRKREYVLSVINKFELRCRSCHEERCHREGHYVARYTGRFSGGSAPARSISSSEDLPDWDTY